jgi:hypothetical protein
LGCGVDGVKDFNFKQSAAIVLVGSGLLLVGLYLFSPFFAGKSRGKYRVTELEEAELASAINRYWTVYQQYPTGENAAVARILAGDNPQQLQFVTLAENSTNEAGQVLDLWSTPYKITFNSTNSFIITSAGSNRIFGDPDDIIFNSRSNAVPKP